MKPSDISPDFNLKSLLVDKVQVMLSETESRTLPIYAEAELPNDNTPEEFVEILNNGVVRSLTINDGVIEGTLALTIYCQTQTNNTAKFNRINSILSQIESSIDAVKHNGYFYKINRDNYVTPTRISSDIGYSLTTINIEWRATE